MKPLFAAARRRVACSPKGSSNPRILHLRHVTSIRSLATEASSDKKKGGIIRRILLFSTITTVGLYGASTLLALWNERFHDIFVEFIPYGNQIVKFAQQRGWEGHSVDPAAVLKSARATIEKLDRARTDSVSVAQKWIDRAKNKVNGSQPQSTRHSGNSESTSVDSSVSVIPAGEPTTPPASQESSSPDVDAKANVVKIVSKDLPREELPQTIQKAEDALAAEPVPQEEPGLSETKGADPNVYTAVLPVGFEIPPGFTPQFKEKPQTVTEADRPQASPTDIPELPSIASALNELVSSDPVLSQLANTVDHLASFLKENPSLSVNSDAKHLLETAQQDLTALGERFQTMKDQERIRLEERLEEKTKEYSLQLLQLELAAQDKLDQQDEEWRKFAEEERQQLIRAYRAKLEAELQAQSELINQRLKEEVIAQGIELQRRWIREVKVHVEAERGGRLAKLDELTADIKRLSRMTLDNSEYLDENLRLHALWTSIRSLEFIIQHSASRRPFREELRTLRHAVFAGGANEDRLLSTALEVLEESATPDIGVEPFADLASWLTTSVAPRLCSVALVPDENAGVLSYLASSLLSSLRVRRQGLVEGDDVYDVVSRAEYYMNEKDLDSAARELNQLRGPAKVLLHDWLEAARKRLEVLQALEVVKSQATLASLLLIK